MMRILFLIVMLLAQPAHAAEGSQNLSTFFDPVPVASEKNRAAQAPLPDLSKAPKWRDIAANPEFQALPPEKQVEVMSAHFDYWLAPRFAAEGFDVERERAEFLTFVASYAGASREAAKSDTPIEQRKFRFTEEDRAASIKEGRSLAFYATLLQAVAFGIACAIGFWLNKPAPKLWRQVVGFLAGLAIGGPVAIAVWAFAMDALMPEIPGTFKQLIPTMMGKAIWSAVLGAGLGVYFGRQKAKSRILANTPTAPSESTQTPPLATRLHAIKLPAISLERALLGIIAASTLAIAVKLWLAPAPVSYADFDALDKMEERGADPKALDEKRDELRRRIPWVRIVGQ
ncbi:MAG: hypothetical protein KUL87_03935 [Pseudomonas sp.]|nr:hypothetical protein [Pseudomonas sp.]